MAADLLALSINAFAPLARCFGVQSPGTGSGKGPVVPTNSVGVIFDVRSEAAGPIEIEFDEPVLRVAAKRPLVGDGPGISQDQIIVRQPQTNKLVLSLRDLADVAPGTYQGSLQIETQTRGLFDIGVSAECRPSLWWRL